MNSWLNQLTVVMQHSIQYNYSWSWGIKQAYALFAWSEGGLAMAARQELFKKLLVPIS